MSKDVIKFHKMTRPVKFRRLKVLFQYVGHTYVVGIERVKYLFNYILYKLRILKRHTDKRNTEIWRPLINGKRVEGYTITFNTEHFAGTIQSELVDHLVSKEDYFYYIDRKGNRHRTYTVEDWEHHEYKISSSVIKPGLIINGKTYMYGYDVPKIVRQYKHPEIKPTPFNEEDKVIELRRVRLPEPEVVEYDLSKILNIRYETILGDDARLDVSYASVQGAVQEGQREIKRYLSNLTLKDIEV